MSDYNNTQGFELGWDDEIENDSPEYITLPEGEYDFTVTGFERGRFQPGPNSKLPPCNMATLTVELQTQDGLRVPVKDKLYLHSSTEGFLCEFFTCIGQRRHGERVRMNWSAVVGSHGRAKVGVRTYQKDEEERTINEIKKYLEPAGQQPTAPAAAPAASAPAQTSGSQTAMPGYNFRAGRF